MLNGTLITEAKGRFAETIVSTVLEFAGYRVLRLGVEEVVSEVKSGAARGEAQLRLPEQLRTAPDLLVVDAHTGACTLLEVKFRRTFNQIVAEELYGALSRQQMLCPETVTAVVCASPPEGGERGDIRDYVRCLKPGDLCRLLEDHDKLSRWRRLRSLGGVFEQVWTCEGLYEQSEQLVAPIRAWA